MEYKEFIDYIKKQTKRIAGKEKKVELTHIIKNNDMEYDGIVILDKDDYISPTIYLDYYYEEYREGKDIDSIVMEIMLAYEQNKDRIDIKPSDIYDFEAVKGRIMFKLVNSKKNTKLLSRLVHRPILDLEIVYYILFDEFEDGSITSLIYTNHMERWGVTEEDIYRLAYENTRRVLGASIRRMDDIIKDILFEQAGSNRQIYEETVEMLNMGCGIDMYVLTNDRKNLGAVSVLYTDILYEFAKKLERNLYILPSSIHEVIIIPKEEEYKKEDLSLMVNEINSTEVHPSEVLSENVYEYDYASNRII